MGDEQYCLFLYASANERRRYNIILYLILYTNQTN